MHRAVPFVALALLLASCGSSDQPDAVSMASEAPPLSKRDIGDIGFANRMIMARYAAEDRRNPKLKPDIAYGEWVIEAAKMPTTAQGSQGIVSRRDARAEWEGSTVSFGAEQVRLTPVRAGLLAADPALGTPLVHPRCTRPEFGVDLSNAAGDLTDEVDLYLHFGLEPPVRGRYFALRCQGGRRDANGLSSEDAGGPYSLFVYDRDRIILQWGALEFLLRRTAPKVAD